MLGIGFRRNHVVPEHTTAEKMEPQTCTANMVHGRSFMYKTKPTAAFARAKKGTPSGLPRNAEIVASLERRSLCPSP